jgi:hypothetical protein
MIRKTIISILFFCLFIIVCIWEFIIPIFNSNEATFSGKVISIEILKRTGSCYITLREKTTNFSFFYSCRQASDISLRDSVFKNSSFEKLYVKSAYDGIIRVVND